uniref:Uncharacterized protein n=1 Tax=Anguilla anguilla TaxID=7936 RepID=A0A0E9PTW8_ANGAN
MFLPFSQFLNDRSVW